MTFATLAQRLAAAHEALDPIGQDHLLTHYDRLDEAGRANLLAQIEGIDWPEVGRLVQSHVKTKPEAHLPSQLEPAPAYPATPGPDLVDRYKQAREHGEKLIRHGKVAAFTVAGGQGTRLGWRAPKGTFPATPIRKLPLFGVFAEYLHKVNAKYRTAVPWYVMTSPVNDGPTRAFFKQHDYFGLDAANVMFFPQQMMPAFDMQTGKALMEAPDSIAMSPNGHGGSLKALFTSGAIDDMKKRGVEQISYFQVDNPTVRCIDPLFIGLHDLDKAQMSSKMIPKRDAFEKVGVFTLCDGKVTVIEYSDFPAELAEERDDAGELRYRAGSIAIHVLRRDFVEKLNAGQFQLPWHRAEKKVAYMDLESGQQHKPSEPNAVKLETFVFDALPLCDKSIVYETDRVQEFAPIKNADTLAGEAPASDSAETSKALQTERAALWLESRGVKVARKDDGTVDAVIELKPTTAIEPADLDHPHGVTLPASIDPGAEVLL